MANLRSEVIITANAKQAAEVMKVLKKQTADLGRTLKQLKADGKENSQQYQDLLKRYQALTTAVKQNYTAQEKIDKVMKNLSGSTLRQLKSALSECKKEMNKMSADNPGLPKLRSQMAAIEAQIRKVTGAASGFNKVMKNMASYFSAFMILQQVVGKLKQVITLNLKYSDQLADIRKVSGLAAEDVDRLSRSLQKIDTRTSQEQINALAYAGSRLGMGKYGVEGLTAFTRAADQVNVALHEDLGDEALTQLAKMTEVMGLIPKMGVEKALLSTGSAIFKLASTSTSNGEHIVQFAERLTGLAKASGITTDQILALGSASDSMMLMPEVAATAFSKLITAMQVNHNLIEKNLSIPDGTINQLYSSGRAMDAIVVILEKMKEKGNMNALNDIFKDLGSDGARLKNVMVTMSQNLDMLKTHLNTSAVAFEDATAVTAEYKIQQDTANAILERANNMWIKAFVNPEGRDNVKDMTHAWYDLSKMLTSSNTYMTMIGVTMKSMATIIKVLIISLPVLINYLMFQGVLTVLKNIWTTFAALPAAINAMRTALNGATVAQTGLNIAMKANFWIQIASWAIAAATAIYSYVSASKQAKTATDKFNSSLNGTFRNIAQLQAEVGRYKKAIEQATKGTNEHAAAIKNFNSKFGKYLSNLLTEKSTAQDLAKAYAEVCKQIRNKALLEAKQKDIEKFVNPRVGWEVDALSKYDELANKLTKFKPYNGEWLKAWVDDMEAAGKSAEWMSKEISRRAGVSTENANRIWANRGQQASSIISYRNENGGAEAENIWANGEASWLATNYIAQRASTKHQLRLIDQKYKPYEQDLAAVVEGDGTPDPGSLDNDAVDKEALAAARKAEAERLKAEREAELARQRELRLQLADANAEANTLQTDIKNFYEQQIADIYEAANASGMSEQMTKGMVQDMKTRMATALTSAREALVGLESQDAQTFQESWRSFLRSMSTDIIDEANAQNDLLLEQLAQFHPEKYKTAVANIAKMLNKPEGTVISSTWEKATRTTMNEQREQNRQRHLDKEELLKNSHVTKTNADTENKFDQLGFTAPSDAQRATLLAGGDDAKVIVDARKAAYDKLFTYVRKNIVDLYNLTEEQQGNADNILDAIFGDDTDTKNAVVAALPGLTQQVGEDAQAMYASLLRYQEDYNTAVRKQLEEQKKNLEMLWKHNDNNPENLESPKHTEYKSAEAGAKAYDMFESAGFDLRASADPEIELYRMKMEAAQAYYDFLAAHGADAQLMADQEERLTEARAAYEEKMLEVQKEKLDRLREFGDGLEEAGSTLGEALGDSEKSVKEAAGEIINSFMKITTDMIKEYTIQAIQTRIFSAKKKAMMLKDAAAEKAIETATQAETTAIVTTGEETKATISETMAAGTLATKTTLGAETSAMQATQAATDVSTEATKAGVTTSLGIAEGAAKTIGSLGWWGIPLVAVISALLGGLLAFAMSKVSAAFGGGGDTDVAEGSNIKLAQGMLTYDAGNVQAFSGVKDGKTYPVVGNDGKVYAAKTAEELTTGLVSDPIAALVNGEPALVAEKGPEMIIGRETTAAMQMARPDLMRDIVEFDRRHSRGQGYHTYDRGNAQDFAPIGMDANGGFTSDDVLQMRDALNESRAVNAALLQQIQSGIKVNMWGRGGLHESIRNANQFAKQVGI